MIAPDELDRCERCGWRYEAVACLPGRCQQRPLPPLRPGRTANGAFDSKLYAAWEERQSREELIRAADLVRVAAGRRKSEALHAIADGLIAIITAEAARDRDV